MHERLPRARYRQALSILAIVAAALATVAGAQAAVPQDPPPEWASYLAAARKAEESSDPEARCLAYPDLPGNEWPAGLAKARCTLVRKPMLSLDEIDALLAIDGGAAELDKRYAALLQDHYRDPARRDQIFLAYRVFDAADRGLQVGKRWLQASPRSPHARMALGRHYATQGWDTRGTKLARETPKAQLQAMEGHFASAVPLLLEAFALEPRLVPACTELAAIGRMSSDELQQGAMQACVRADPLSYFVLQEWLLGAQPKWGGSHDAMRQVVAFAAARVDENPVLGSLLAFAAGYDADNESKWKDPIPSLVGATRIAPDAWYLGGAGTAYAHVDEPWPAIVYLSQALRFRPQEADFWYRRGVELNQLGYHAWALADMQAAIALEPEDGWNHYEMGRTLLALSGPKASRPHFRQAMEDTEVRKPAYAMWCQSFDVQGESREALSCSEGMIGEYPDEGEAWRLRAYALGAAGEVAVYDAIDRFLATMDPDKYRHHAAWAKDFRRFIERVPRERFGTLEQEFFRTP